MPAVRAVVEQVVRGEMSAMDAAMRSILVAAVFAGALAGRAGAQDPNFNCEKATQWSDMMVCGNPSLVQLDGKVDKAYKRSQEGLTPEQANEVQEVHDAWRKGREKCQQDPDPIKCLQDYYQDHIKKIVQPGEGY